MKTFEIDSNDPQGEKLIEFLKTLPYVNFIKKGGEPREIQEEEVVNDPFAGVYDYQEIAENLDMGMRTFVHKDSGEIQVYPEEVEIYGEIEDWQEVIDKVDNDEAFIRIYPMASRESFGVMESFTEQLEEGGLKRDLKNALERKKPFRNFSNIVQKSELRDEWFTFKTRKLADFVREQLENELNE